MANTIKIKRSGIANVVPGSLEYGELAINYADGKIYYKNNANNIVELVSTSSASINIDAGTASSVYENDPTLALDGGGA